MIIKEELMSIICFVEKKKIAAEEELRSLPKTSLGWVKRYGEMHAQNCRTVNGKRLRKDITEDSALITKLLRAEYLRKELDYLNRVLGALKLADGSISDWSKSEYFANAVIKYPQMDANFIENAVYGNHIQEGWATENYERNMSHPEHLIHTTSRGLKVRSKNELLIAEKLYDFGIPFRYDAILRLENGIWISPDFCILRADGEIIYWEHFGMMENKSYREGMRRKLEIYEGAGIIPGNNLIMTFGNSNESLDVRVIDNTIKLYLAA